MADIRGNNGNNVLNGTAAAGLRMRRSRRASACWKTGLPAPSVAARSRPPMPRKAPGGMCQDMQW